MWGRRRRQQRGPDNGGAGRIRSGDGWRFRFVEGLEMGFVQVWWKALCRKKGPRGRDRKTMAPPPPPELIDDAVAEILLRLPPDDPGCLLRASLVCKTWRRVLSDPSFPRRYREFHRTPPLLGFTLSVYTGGAGHITRLVIPNPTAARIPFLQPDFGCWALDCRHGRVLLLLNRVAGLAVWDPITGDRKVLPKPDGKQFCSHSGAVLCAAEGCDHRDCRGGPFLVVLVGYSATASAVASAWVYSSEATAWSAPASVQIGERRFMVEMKRAAIVGDEIH